MEEAFGEADEYGDRVRGGRRDLAGSYTLRTGDTVGKEVVAELVNYFSTSQRWIYSSAPRIPCISICLSEIFIRI